MDFETIINRIINILKIKNKAELCKIMNVSTATMGNWKIRNKIPFEEIIKICKEYELDTNYIFFGLETYQLDIEIIKNSIKFRVNEKEKNNNEDSVPELFLLEDILGRKETENLKGFIELCNFIKAYNIDEISLIQDLFQTKKELDLAKEKLIKFLDDFAPQEIEHLIKNGFVYIEYEESKEDCS